MVDDGGFAKGDLAGVMSKHPHVEKWVQDFEARYGSRPEYYGPLDRDAKKAETIQLNLHHKRAHFCTHLRATKR